MGEQHQGPGGVHVWGLLLCHFRSHLHTCFKLSLLIHIYVYVVYIILQPEVCLAPHCTISTTMKVHLCKLLPYCSITPPSALLYMGWSSFYFILYICVCSAQPQTELSFFFLHSLSFHTHVLTWILTHNEMFLCFWINTPLSFFFFFFFVYWFTSTFALLVSKTWMKTRE